MLNGIRPKLYIKVRKPIPKLYVFFNMKLRVKNDYKFTNKIAVNEESTRVNLVLLYEFKT